jgi:hypothetical protein
MLGTVDSSMDIEDAGRLGPCAIPESRRGSDPRNSARRTHQQMRGKQCPGPGPDVMPFQPLRHKTN